MRPLARALYCVLVLLLSAAAVRADETPVSDATQECLDCHAAIHPGIVADWQQSRHAAVTPAAAMERKAKTPPRVSAPDVPEALRGTAVGCAECHTLRGEAHADTFEHNGHRIHLVPSPDDCAVCHAEERTQFADNIMALAEKNLSENALYQDMQRTILGTPQVTPGGLHFTPEDDLTRADACYYCHGTRLAVRGSETRTTDVGELEFPVISGWPNQGVGRVNLDGSRGSCSACHTRHLFSIQTARKPYTCKECHVGPDVPAFKVYSASKHGNLFSTHEGAWDFAPVPWRPGRDFGAPTCAVCHISQSVNADGVEIVPRTHRMNDRLGWRIFGLIYAHPQPRSPDTSIIRNRAGLPLPTDLDGAPASPFLISAEETASRRARMQAVCLNCHGGAWVNGFFKRLDHSITTSNAAVRAATEQMQIIWQKGYAKGPAAGGSLFDEAVERRWSDAWLLYANNVRFVSAMAGGGDYGVFEDGRYHLSKALLDLQDWLALREKIERGK